MGRIFIFIGVLMIGAGVILPLTSIFNVVGNMNIESMVNPTAAEFCASGEQLETEAGAATRNGTGSTATTGRQTFYFCVNNAGTRREVTDAVMNDVTSGVANVMGSVQGVLGSGLATAGLTISGVALIMLGVVMMRGSNRSRLAVGAQNPYGSTPTDSPFNTGGGARLTTMNFEQPNVGGHDAKSVVNFVRDQLDAAYRSGQISREDYDRAIEKLNRR